MRKQIVAGNWKMNKVQDEAIQLTSEIIKLLKANPVDSVIVVLAPPFPFLKSVSDEVGNSDQVFVAAQNCYEKSSGAFTGEVSPEMVNSVGASHVILGHSERRQYFQESDEFLASKVDLVLENQLTPIFCCGEPLEIREAETHFEYVSNQITASLFHLSETEFSKLVIAYEPIWAIGTGRTASREQAQEMHAHLRGHVREKYGESIADNLTLLYGGSCNPGNAKELFSCPDVDGGLIGGASLKAHDFVDIISSF